MVDRHDHISTLHPIAWLDRMSHDKGVRMRATVLVSIFLALYACAAPPTSRQPALAGLESVPLPEYDSDRGIGWACSREEFASARADTLYTMRQFTYPSDGLTVGAYLYESVKPASKLRPIIVFNRGSFVRPNGFAGEMLVMAHRYAQAGYIVVAPQYRGSNGWAGRDELGGAELHDLMNLVPQLARIPGADSHRVYLSGESRGGAMVYMALRDGFPARAAAVWGAFTDLAPLVGPGGPQEKAAPMVWPDFAQRREEIIRSRSALYWAADIHVPVLIMHGGVDQDIPVSQSQRMDVELTRLGSPHKLLVFDDQQHVIGGRGAERDAAALQWFARYDAGP
jgi:dipeptidyl aminopeptidase/acylaminoacyl peptidase